MDNPKRMMMAPQNTPEERKLMVLEFDMSMNKMNVIVMIGKGIISIKLPFFEKF